MANYMANYVANYDKRIYTALPTTGIEVDVPPHGAVRVLVTPQRSWCRLNFGGTSHCGVCDPARTYWGIQGPFSAAEKLGPYWLLIGGEAVETS